MPRFPTQHHDKRKHISGKTKETILPDTLYFLTEKALESLQNTLKIYMLGSFPGISDSKGLDLYIWKKLPLIH